MQEASVPLSAGTEPRGAPSPCPLSHLAKAARDSAGDLGSDPARPVHHWASSSSGLLWALRICPSASRHPAAQRYARPRRPEVTQEAGGRVRAHFQACCAVSSEGLPGHTRSGDTGRCRLAGLVVAAGLREPLQQVCVHTFALEKAGAMDRLSVSALCSSSSSSSQS